MPDTIQMVQVAPVHHDAMLGTTVTFFDDNDQRWAITGDVIELTEERSSFPGGNFPGRRWVSTREPVDA